MFNWLFTVSTLKTALDIYLGTGWKGYSEKSLKQEICEYFSDIGELSTFLEYDLTLPFDAFVETLEKTQTEKQVILTALYNREYSARLEFYGNLEQNEKSTCKPFYIINNIHSCSLSPALASSKVLLTSEFDHIIHYGSGSLIAYVDITDSSFPDLHKKILEFCIENDLTYILRHLDLRDNTEDYLGGYGVEANMKNMEYNPTEDVNATYIPLPKWETEGLSYKMVECAMSLNTITDIKNFLENLPENIEKISKTTPSSSISRELDKSLYSSQQSNNILLINNHIVKANFFDILPVIRAELKSYQSLLSLNIPQDKALKLKTDANLNLHLYQNRPKPIKTPVSTGRVYLNDLEKDDKYGLWSKNYEEFFFAYGNELLPIGLNFFNLILICDVNFDICWKTLKNFVELIEVYPIHFGVVLVGDLKITSVLMEGLKSLRKADEDFVLEFVDRIKYGMSPEELTIILKETCIDCDIDLEYSNAGKRCEEFCETVGLCGPVQLLLNGKLLSIDPSHLIDESSIEEAIFYELSSEKRFILNLAMRGVLNPPLDSFFEKLAFMNTTDRVNAEISSVGTGDIKLAPFLPKSSFNIIKPKSLGFFHIFLTKNDTKLARIFLDALERYSHLAFSYNIYFYDIENIKQWDEIISKTCPKCSENDVFNKVLESQNQMKKLGLTKGTVIVNGRIIDGEHFKNYRDFIIAYECETSRIGTQSIADNLEGFDKVEEVSYALLKSSRMIKDFEVYRSNPLPQMMQPKAITKVFKDENPVLEVSALINLASKEAIVMLTLCEWMKSLNASITITFQSSFNDAKIPVYRYYKYLIKNSFEDSLLLPVESKWTYSLNLDIHSSWMVRPVKSSLDLDNLHSPDHQIIQYKLKSLLIQGHCAQTYRGFDMEPPNGLQLVLKNSSNIVADTIVMKNLGYFQFQAKPGAYFINLANGRSEELFQISKGQRIDLMDIVGDPALMAVSKYSGMENEELLETGSASDIGDVINIFSLASGKLYERLIKIMMSSVMKFTKEKVKFWLLEDFFSPGFTDDIDKLAKALGFEYELLSYKWPSWLYAQTEKQRIIWGYKILFLDVLFPLKLGRVIYIDADQVVRTDVKELWDLDLEGAPYAYTPFCDSNPLTQKFMFWKSGYWKNHLKDLPYHISALYIIDLNRFRDLGAGDILRYFYDSLAQSPDSLSNLDQDLPNFTQTHLKIFSLPQEWLWCASWCSEESKEQAKSIDLCNNPLTREHKIEAAKKYIPEWNDYDLQVKRILQGEKTLENHKEFNKEL